MKKKPKIYHYGSFDDNLEKTEGIFIMLDMLRRMESDKLVCIAKNTQEYLGNVTSIPKTGYSCSSCGSEVLLLDLGEMQLYDCLCAATTTLSTSIPITEERRNDHVSEIHKAYQQHKNQ